MINPQTHIPPNAPRWLLEELAVFFAYEHIPWQQHEIAHHFALLALRMVQITPTPTRPETGAVLRKLLETRDMFILLNQIGDDGG